MKIFNASPIILILEILKEPSIFHQIYKIDNELYIPLPVIEEITSVFAKNELRKLIQKGILKVYDFKEDKESIFLNNRYPYLHKGEIAVISITKNNGTQKCQAVIDESKARSVATKIGIKKIGCLGLLLELNKKQIIDIEELKLLCRKIDKSIFRIDFKGLGYEWLIK
jgi:predicted nucleic acid-binding protein